MSRAASPTAPSRAAASLVALLVALLPGCTLTALNDALARVTPAVVSDRAFAWGERPPVARADGWPATRAAALERFGPPGEVLGLVDGDVFVYRWRQLELGVLNLHSGFVTPVAVPLYGRLDGDQRDRSLMLAFDRDGRLRHAAVDGPAPGLGAAPPAAPRATDDGAAP